MKMKKLWASLLCLMMVLVMGLTMTACEVNLNGDDKETSNGEDETSIVGKWKADIDIAEWAEIMGATDEETDFFEMIGVDTLAYYVEYKENGKGKAWFDGDDIIDSCKASIESEMEKIAAEYDMTLDELLEAQGLTLDEAMDEFLAGAGAPTIEELEEMFEMEVTGYYELDGETLLSGDSKDDLEEKGTFDGKKIVLEKDGVEIVFKRA